MLCTADWSGGSSVRIVETLWLDDLAMGAKFMAGNVDFCHPYGVCCPFTSLSMHSGNIFLGGNITVALESS